MLIGINVSYRLVVDGHLSIVRDGYGCCQQFEDMQHNFTQLDTR